MIHICVSKLTVIGSDNGLSPGRRQAIIWTIAWISSIGILGTNFSENVSEIHTFSFKKMHLKMSSGKWQPFCLGFNVLRPDYSIRLRPFHVKCTDAYIYRKVCHMMLYVINNVKFVSINNINTAGVHYITLRWANFAVFSQVGTNSI